jgi:hypothetical protein
MYREMGMTYWRKKAETELVPAEPDGRGLDVHVHDPDADVRECVKYRDVGMTYWLEQAEAEMRQLG